MKHSIVIKFIAVALCAAFLMGAVGSGVGALCLTEMGLYEQTVDEVYTESRDALAEVFANQLAQNYASQTLGECPEEMTDNYVHFNAGYYGYTVTDSTGTIVKERALEEGTAQWTYRFDVQTQYQKLLETRTESELFPATEPVVTPTYSDLQITDNISVDGIWVNEVYFYDRYGNDTSYTDENLGILYRVPEGNVYFQAHTPDIRLPGDEVVHATFRYDSALLFEISCSDGVGNAAVDDNGLLSITFHKERNPAIFYGEDYEVYDALPPEGAEVQQISVEFYEGGSESCGKDGVLGYLSYQEDGSLLFTGEDSHTFLSQTGPVSRISFLGLNDEVLYSAHAESGGVVGEIYWTGERVEFRSFLAHLDENDRVDTTSVIITEPPMTTIVATAAPEASTEMPTEAPYTLFNAIPAEGAEVGQVSYLDGDNETVSTFSINSLTQGNKTGVITFAQDGSVLFATSAPSPVKPDGDTFYYIAFYDLDGQLIYEAQREEGVGTFRLDENNFLHFQSTMEAPSASVATEPPTEPYIEPTTIPDTTTATTEVTIPIDIPEDSVIIAEVTDPTEAATIPRTASYAQRDITYTYYYDRELGQNVEAAFVYEDMPEPYSVEIRLAKGAYEMDAVYDLLNWIWLYRNEMLYILGVSLLGFAITAVYLCCAAGKKKDREEIRAGGFNSLSLDVYLAAGILAVCGLTVIGFEGGYYLLRYSPQNLVPFALIMSYAAALIIVGFCFACAAQFKTPGCYWWRNTLTFRCLKLAVQLLRWAGKAFIRFMRWLERFLGSAFPVLGRVMKACWNWLIRFCLVVYRYTEKGLTWLGQFIGRLFRKVAACVHAFLVMLPVTWQWLLVGFGMLLLMALVFATNGEELLVVLCLGACVAIILYGAHCFGVLLDSTRRMGKGDLETKVDDKLMIGSFKEFASDLNALGDVAVIAAQKQMKSERMKAELITNVSHDIKTPLTSIINYVDLLQKPHTEEEQETYLEVLSRQSQQMKKLLEDLIEMSKASTGNMTVNITRINAVEAVNQALGEFADKLEKAQLTPMVHQPEDAIYMQADGRLAWRVLSNILSNAVKYALPGTRVYIDVMELDGNVLISMKNISREALNVSADELMERFVRGDASRNTEGSGLGLNIAQSLMEIQKGKLQLLVDGDLFKVTLIFPGAKE